jgi:hypothetical protein
MPPPELREAVWIVWAMLGALALFRALEIVLKGAL